MNKELSLNQAKPMSSLSGVARILEVSLVICHAFAIFMMLALITFHPSDPSWTQTAWEGEIHNSAGAAGAWLADILLFAFGIAAYLMPFVTVALAWLLFWKPKGLLSLDYLALGLRVIGFIFIVLGVTALAALNFDDIYYFSSGGVVGDILSKAMVSYFGLLGSTLILLCFIATGFTLFTGISLLMFVDKLGEYSIRASRALLHIPSTWRQYKSERAAKSAQQDGDSVLFAKELPKKPAEPTNPNDPPLPSLDKILPEFESAMAAEPVGHDRLQTSQIQANSDANVAPVIQHDIDEPKLGEEEVAPAFAPDPCRDDDLNMPWMPDPDEEALPAIFADDVNHPPVEQQTAVAAKQHDHDPALADALVQLQQKKAMKANLAPLPSIDLLDRPNKAQNPITQEDIEQVSRLVEAKLLDFNVQAKVMEVYPGPVITQFQLELAPGIKVSKITGLAKDLARALSAMSVRVVEVIPNKTYIGLELPNKYRETVYLREVLDCQQFKENASPLTMVLGSDIAGKPVVVDLAKMPHLLVAGTTGSGKSVGVNCMIVSLLYKSSPEDVRLIMIDPKMLELSVYEGIPHLLAEVVTDMKDASNALRWCVGEMERRYKLMSAVGVRNLKGYNAKVKAAIDSGNPMVDPLWKPGDSMDEMAPELTKLPSIVVVVDEFADMMMIVGKKVEELIARIAQKARAAGIHLILATQRPSVDVITGLIKANVPTRMAFQVSSKIDSRTILDQQGAESLLGMGDMLYLPPGTSVPERVHGAFVDDHEVHKVVADWKLRGEPDYIDDILSGDTTADNMLPGEVAEAEDDVDALYDEAVAFVTETRRGSVSGVQRKFKIGYNRAARIVEQMEQQGIVSAPGHNGNREVLAPPPPRN
ncbi:DNA translocase FtsK [Motilimonas eburnea]|uniref:DNA translocase FtsK n=1 Tax=Motilimonas eburnea TaxID=1737488 RepID=UPI001E3C7A56|nr:DNA translocase FtsK [Motilimonas eburnea]MCE2573190.1 DNA translocase FtsK 4TM domain-containing protein [Motilimonas eburnea]